MAAPLSLARLKSARRDFNIFNLLNSFSFVFVSGSFITLFAVRLGASNAVVGILNAIAYSTYFLMPLGKRVVKFKPIIWTFGWAWVGRYTALVPILFAPMAAAGGHEGIAIGLLIAGTAGFALSRGVGMIGNNPVIAYIASGGGDKPRSDRGEYVVTTSIASSVASMVSGLLLALFLGEDASPGTYAIGVGIGIAFGFAGSVFLLRLPEPTDFLPGKTSSLIKATKEAAKDHGFRRFILIFMVLALASGMGRSFLPVYAKEIFSQGDDAVMIYALIASMGSVAMGFLSKLLVDRLGSKPLMIIFNAIGLISFLPIALLPSGSVIGYSMASIALILSLIHFLSNFGLAGGENAAHNYYFALVPKEKNLDLSVTYYIAYGLGGALGSGLGGLLLDSFIAAGLNPVGAYRLLYAVLCLVIGLSIFSMRKLKRLGSRSVSQSLGVMLSPRDLRAFDLLSKLDRSSAPEQEVRLIQEIGQSASLHTQEELLDYLHSPSFEVRMQALLAIEQMSKLSVHLVRPLIQEVELHPFTTAYVAARILGTHQRTEALPVLRKALEIEDYILQGSSLIALANIGDRDSIPMVESMLMRSTNPRVKISAAHALQVFNSRDSLPVLVASLRKDDPSAFVSDEIILAIAAIIGIMGEFYPLYSAFSEDEAHGLALLESSAQDIIADARTMEEWKQGVRELFDPKEPDGRKIASLIHRIANDERVEMIFGEAIIDPQLCYKGMQFLATAYPLLISQQAEGYGAFPGRSGTYRR